jgi:CheY-like chemotaxis protein
VRILLIEDDHANIELMRLRLEALECQVDVATTAAAGLAMAIEGQPDLVLVDLKLEHDANAGIELVKALHANPATKALPLVIHSIFVSHPADAPEALPLAQGYLPKPFRFLDLKKMVDEFRAGAVAQSEGN